MPERSIITDSKNFPIQPHHVNAKEHFFDAFDNMETEISARYVVKLCQKLGSWGPFTEEQIEEIYQKAGFRGFTFNRLVNSQLVPPSLVRAFMGHHDTPVPVGGGWIILGDDDKYYVTDDFVTRCFQSSPVKKSTKKVSVAA